MKQKLVKVMYMGFGALIALTGYMFGTMNDSLNAQQTEPFVIDEIVVQKLRVVDVQGNTIAVLAKKDTPTGEANILSIYNAVGDPVIALNQNSAGGAIELHGTDGGHVSLNVGDGRGGALFFSGKEGGHAALGIKKKNGAPEIILSKVAIVNEKLTGGSTVLGVDDAGGYVNVGNYKNNGSTQLSTNEMGGVMAIFNNGGRNVLQASVADTGGGTIITKDKLGYKTGNVP
ncbi:MAG: hypothetical protein OXU27_13400 [Candidatus Poribacteria bacterium]|nr:hypothetical protein [Candidatus Poribacteria bacterium]